LRSFHPCPRNEKTFKIPNKNGPIGLNPRFVSRFLAYTQKEGNEGPACRIAPSARTKTPLRTLRPLREVRFLCDLCVVAVCKHSADKLHGLRILLKPNYP
ncbi:MAG TPA: hypothetical protein VGJ73_01880, partial [Verrucomicrobiae bacterium]